MKIGLNGTNRGLGQFLVNFLGSDHDIIKVKNRLPDLEAVINEVESCDVFINVVHHNFDQVDLLLGLVDRWEDKEKLIINIGSRAVYQNASPNPRYSAAKIALQSAAENVLVNKNKKCRLCTINAGLIEKIEGYSLRYEEVGLVVKWCLELPAHVEVSRIDVQHRTPYRLVQAMKLEKLQRC